MMATPTRKAVEAARRANLKHGHARLGHYTPEYKVWAGMKSRCLNVRAPRFVDYGGRGITVCARWYAFENFLADMGARPSLAHTLERKDNDGGYTPDNCCWATKTEQSRNRRGRQHVTINSETKLICEWSAISGLPIGRIWKRLKEGWSPEAAVSAPPRSRATLTHCKAGHRYTPENVRWVNRGRARRCLVCRRAYIQKWNAKQREVA